MGKERNDSFATLGHSKGPCPYLPEREAVFLIADARLFSGAEQESMLAERWRRSGGILYRPVCRGCAACIPLRLDVRSPLEGMRVAAARARNRDVESRLLAPAFFSDEHFSLYRRYLASRHGSTEDAVGDYTGSFLSHPRIDMASETSPLIMEYRHRESGTLLALGFLDAFPDGLSSVYFAFDPDQGRRSLGVYSVGVESDAVRAMGKRWYYLGFWVPGARTMDYKAGFRPFGISLPGGDGVSGWRPCPDRTVALARAEAAGVLPPAR